MASWPTQQGTIIPDFTIYQQPHRGQQAWAWAVHVRKDNRHAQAPAPFPLRRWVLLLPLHSLSPKERQAQKKNCLFPHMVSKSRLLALPCLGRSLQGKNETSPTLAESFRRAGLWAALALVIRALPGLVQGHRAPSPLQKQQAGRAQGRVTLGDVHALCSGVGPQQHTRTQQLPGPSPPWCLGLREQILGCGPCFHVRPVPGGSYQRRIRIMQDRT